MSNNVIMHHGVKGQRWGVRRYQNADGTLTKAGVARYAKAQYRQDKEASSSGNNPRSYAKEKYKQSSMEANISAAKKYLRSKGFGIDNTTSESIKSNGKRNAAKGIAGAVVGSAAVAGLAVARHAFVKKAMLGYLDKNW